MSINKSNPYLMLWLKFKPEHRKNDRGTAQFGDNFSTEVRKKYLVSRYKKLIDDYKKRDLIWQARIYEQPGNQVIHEWREPFETPQPAA
jgi:phage tail tube protein FII